MPDFLEVGDRHKDGATRLQPEGAEAHTELQKNHM